MEIEICWLVGVFASYVLSKYCPCKLNKYDVCGWKSGTGGANGGCMNLRAYIVDTTLICELEHMFLILNYILMLAMLANIK